MSLSQLAAASSRCVTTSPTSGRDVMSPSQQRWVNPHNESENPMAEAFSGLPGRLCLSTTWYAISHCGTPGNGTSPVRTLDNVSKRPTPAILLAYLKDNHSKCVDVRLRCGFGDTGRTRHQEFWRHEHRCAAPQLCTTCHRVVRVVNSGNRTEVREACTKRGVVGHDDVRLVNVKKESVAKEETPTPFRFPCATSESWRYFRPWAAPCNYCRILVEEVAGKVKSRTSSNLLARFFSIYFMTFPCTIHSDTMTNCPFSMSS